MLIIGAGGLAKEILEIVNMENHGESIAFFDDVNPYNPPLLYEKHPILRSIQEVESHFKTNSKNYIIGIGEPELRKMLIQKIDNCGGVLTSIVSSKANIGSHGVEIGNGANIFPNVNISNNVRIGLAALIYYNVVITHDCQIGDFVELSPGATLLGHVKVGDHTKIGANATVLPKLTVGKNVTIGAGAVVTKSLPDNCTAIGVPARIIESK